MYINTLTNNFINSFQSAESPNGSYCLKKKNTPKMSLHKDSNSVSAVFIPNDLVHRGIQILIKLAGNGSVGRGVYHQG